MSDSLRPTGGAPHTTLVEMIVEDPGLVAAVRALPGPAMAELIDQIGLADAGPLVALMGPEQFEAALDEDLWRLIAPGTGEHFDAARFMLWLEILLDLGSAQAVERLAALPEEAVVFGFHQCLRVYTSEALGMAIEDNAHGRLAEKLLEASGYYEIEDYLILPRQEEGLDAVMQALLALEKHDSRFMLHVLDRCATLSAGELADSDGLHALLSEAESLECDLAGARDDRRAALGFVPPAQAAAYLKFARQTDPDSAVVFDATNPTLAFFRRRVPLREAAASPIAASERLAHLLRRPSRTEQVRIESDPMADVSAARPFREAVRQLARQAPETHRRCITELTDAANMLMSGASLGGDRLDRADAALAVAALCELGLATALAQKLGTAFKLVQDHGAEPFLRLGLASAHRDIARAVLARLTRFARKRMQTAPGGTVRDDLAAFCQKADAALEADQPWRAGEVLFNLHWLLSGAEIATLEALIDQLPMLTGTLAQTSRFPASREDIALVETFLDTVLEPGD